LAADKTIIVLDKSNRKLWQSSLNYNIVAGAALTEETAPCGQGPCIERNGSLYVFDAGVLTAFDLKTGNARWRLPSVGIAGIFFDDHDLMYVNTTTASPDSIRYQRQIDVSDKVSFVVLKVDSRNGKMLWSIQSPGLISYVSGKIVLLSQSYTPADEDEDSSPLGAAQEPAPPHLRIRRLNPGNGNEIWEHYEDRAPLDIGFDNDRIRLVFKKEVEVLKFRTWGL
jgi:outer membrane protein assembly factor BamB